MLRLRWLLLALPLIQVAPALAQQANSKPPESGGPLQPVRQALEALRKQKTDRHGDLLPAGAVDRFGSSRWRHGGALSLVALTPDGKSVLTVGDDETVRFWDLKTGRELRRITLGSSSTSSRGSDPRDPRSMRGGRGTSGFGGPRRLPAALSPDGKILAVWSGSRFSRGGGSDTFGSLRLWDTTTGKELPPLKDLRTSPSILAWSSDAKAMVLADFSGRIEVREVSGGKTLATLATGSSSSTDRFPSRGGRGGGTRPSGPSDLTFSPDGKLVMGVVSRTGGRGVGVLLRIWDVASGKVLQDINGSSERGSSACAWSPDGRLIAWVSPGENPHVRLIDPSTGKDVGKLPCTSSRVKLAFTPDAKYLITDEESEGKAVVWEVLGQKKIREIAAGEKGAISPYGGSRAAPRVSADSKLVLLPRGPALLIVELATGNLLNPPDGPRGPVQTLRWTADGKSLLAQANDLTRWDFADGKRSLLPWPSDAALARDGRHLIAVTAQDYRLLDVHTGKAVGNVPRPDEQMTSALLSSPDGKILAIKSYETGIVRLYSTQTGKHLHTLSPPPPPTLPDSDPPSPSHVTFFSTDGNYLASVGSADLTVWDVRDGRRLWSAPLSPPSEIMAGCFLPDDRTVVVRLMDRLVAWEMATGRERRTLTLSYSRFGRGSFDAGTPIFAAVQADTLAVSPDCRTVATIGRGRDIEVWDLFLGKRIGEFQGHAGTVRCLVFSPDGKRLASAGDDSSILVWDIAALSARARPAETEFPAEKRQTTWQALLSPDGKAAFEAIASLADNPTAALTILKEKLVPAPKLEATQVQKWIQDLDARRFVDRRKAREALEKVGSAAQPYLREAMKEHLSAEQRKVIEAILEKCKEELASGERLLNTRSVEVLERVGNAEAKKLLQVLAEGAPGADLTIQAKAALARLGNLHRR